MITGPINSSCGKAIKEAKIDKDEMLESTADSIRANSDERQDTKCGDFKSIYCAGCRQVITDKYYLSAVDSKWHTECLKCFQCGKNLDTDGTCFARNGLIYCRDDYKKLFCWHKCNRCKLAINSNEFVMKIKTHLYYHMDCFNCTHCSKEFEKGDLFGLINDKVYCRYHYRILCETQRTDSNLDIKPSRKRCPPSRISKRTKKQDKLDIVKDGKGWTELEKNNESRSTDLKLEETSNTITIEKQSSLTTRKTSTSTFTPAIVNHSLSSSPSSSSSTSSVFSDLGSAYSAFTASSSSYGPHVNASSGRGSKRMRTSFKNFQIRAMKAYFCINHNPDSKDLKELSQKTGLSKRVLQVWFQNARAKWRRNLLRQQSLGPQIVEECKPLAELNRECHLIKSSKGTNISSTSPSSFLSISTSSSGSSPGLCFGDSGEPSYSLPLTIRQEEQQHQQQTSFYSSF